MKIISWNVNGLRSVARKGFLTWLDQESPDILALQEIKGKTDQFPQELVHPADYYTFFNPAQRPGYSGTATYSKIKPLQVRYGFDIPRFDLEGRIVETEYADFTFFNIYFPNGKRDDQRLQYKLDFYDSALEYFDGLVAQGKKLLIAGDYNTAHTPIDLARPKDNENISGFLRVERDWLDKLVAHNYLDCFRLFNPDPHHYTWWSQRARSRERNVGWRIDYFFASQNARQLLKNCYHLDKVTGSDHCPVVLELIDKK